MNQNITQFTWAALTTAVKTVMDIDPLVFFLDDVAEKINTFDERLL